MEGEERLGADASRECRRVVGRRAGSVRPGAGGHTSSRMYIICSSFSLVCTLSSYSTLCK